MTDAASPLTGLALQRESTGEQVAGALREAIVDGRLSSGTYLREAPLARRFGVSRNTVREATQILVGEGLVTREIHRGAFVARPSLHDVHDLYRVRRIVELAAVREATAADLGGMRLALEDFEIAVANDDRVGMIDHDLRFHRELVALMESERLGGLFESMESELRLCLTLVENLYEDAITPLRQHRAILAALEDEDVALAAARLGEHLHRFETQLAGRLSASQAPDPHAA
jgi:DNA-binding GntR family transcriptional regulator